jgi:hypothetical protein
VVTLMIVMLLSLVKPLTTYLRASGHNTYLYVGLDVPKLSIPTARRSNLT